MDSERLVAGKAIAAVKTSAFWYSQAEHISRHKLHIIIILYQHLTKVT